MLYVEKKTKCYFNIKYIVMHKKEYSAQIWLCILTLRAKDGLKTFHRSFSFW